MYNANHAIRVSATVSAPAQAVAEFLQRMHFTEKEFLANKQLLDLVVAYHFIPGKY